MLDVTFSWLLSATPVWLSLCIFVALCALAWQLRTLSRRVGRHARSIAHMDDWADAVDHSLQQMQGRTRRLQASSAAPRQMADTRRWWQK